MPKPDRLPNPEEALNLDVFPCFAIYSAGHALNRVYKPLLDELGLTYPQYLVMVLLWQTDNQTVGSLGEKLFLESSTLTPLLKRLEALRHLQRNRDASDERQVRVCLTKTGRALRAKAVRIPACIIDASGMKREDIRRLQTEITNLRNNLENYTANERNS
jgi:MarR family transcriptional regulator, organic hydroperoxide resistance regulator